jgi:hypothetical protein
MAAHRTRDSVKHNIRIKSYHCGKYLNYQKQNMIHFDFWITSVSTRLCDPESPIAFGIVINSL